MADETVRAIVQGSVDTAREAAGGNFDNLPGSPDEPVTSGDQDEIHAGEGETETEEPAEKPVGAAKKEEKPAAKDVKKKDDKAGDDELDPEVKALVDKHPKNDAREPRIPLSVHKKVLNNARKGRDESTTQIETLRAENERLKERSAHADRWDSLIDSDQDGTVTLQELAKVRPHFAKYLNGGTADNKSDLSQASSGRPKPDYKGADGAVGYTPEGFDKLMGWLDGIEDRAREAARNELKPITEREKLAETRQQLDHVGRQKVKQATDIWGDLFTEDFNKGKNSEVIQYAERNKVTWETALQAVLTPKLKKQHDDALLEAKQKSRDETLAELKKRPAAADNADPTASGEQEEEKKNPTTRDIVAGVVKAHKHRARA